MTLKGIPADNVERISRVCKNALKPQAFRYFCRYQSTSWWLVEWVVKWVVGWLEVTVLIILGQNERQNKTPASTNSGKNVPKCYAQN